MNIVDFHFQAFPFQFEYRRMSLHPSSQCLFNPLHAPAAGVGDNEIDRQADDDCRCAICGPNESRRSSGSISQLMCRPQEERIKDMDLTRVPSEKGDRVEAFGSSDLMSYGGVTSLFLFLYDELVTDAVTPNIRRI